MPVLTGEERRGAAGGRPRVMVVQLCYVRPVERVMAAEWGPDRGDGHLVPALGGGGTVLRNPTAHHQIGPTEQPLAAPWSQSACC